MDENTTPAAAPPSDRRRPSRRSFLLGGAAGALAVVGGGVAWALDRFVLEHVEIADASEFEAENSSVDTSAGTSAADATLTATSYRSDSAEITISTHSSGSGADTLTWYAAEIVLTDATVLRSAFAKDSFGENIIETTSAIAADNGAVFAINGDYYGFRDTGIVLRNGAVFRDSPARDGLAFFTDGSVRVYDETATTANELLAQGCWNTLSFGPAILEDGKVIAGIEDIEIDTNIGNHSIQGEQPRTCIGVIGDNHLVFVVVDGRSTGYSRGATLPELAALMADLGARTAYNLDGGGSSTMVFNDALVNDPLGKGTERGTSDILYIAR
ncbi:phosphodiester glycosidase family protein [Rathayibacter sp. VKM Ac-2835]|uniref:phosphodiester glycosidase family protein n=1 Tax=Rathayibacter sp. VKM Ac-2835 TaxID=2739043 RepID=UPI001566F957|nr:phosphodiester glycosidase family protein [Rathayibacter sp. VKM Ac-2835]NRG41077.1 phosphodiester glycosidase family protein [Rathayibacter sp. VKM Ac-2835]